MDVIDNTDDSAWLDVSYCFLFRPYFENISDYTL
jgi:hypothetical protein